MNRRGFLQASLAIGISAPYIKLDSLMGLYVPKNDFLQINPRLLSVDFKLAENESPTELNFIIKYLEPAAAQLSHACGFEITPKQLRVIRQYDIDTDSMIYRADVYESGGALVQLDSPNLLGSAITHGSSLIQSATL